MQSSDKFITDEKGNFFQQDHPKPIRQTVIKSSNLQIGKPKKIDQIATDNPHRHSGSIFPLIEGDDIVGFVYECSCGEVAKIIFDYEETVGRAAS